MAISRENLSRVEFDWLAIDRDGHLALLSTAGAGDIPSGVLDVASEEQLFDTEAFISVFPVVGAAELEGRGPGTCSEFVEAARRGVFVYDWCLLSGPYERIVVPTHPRVFSQQELNGAVIESLDICFVDEATLVLPRA